MNSKGEAVGQSYSCNGVSRVFLWKDRLMFDVSRLIRANSGFDFTEAFVINGGGTVGV